ncbi:uncharacterized protein LOC122079176 [Macadamia integrifolia]|uniref:uncharacterized protein LOC122079176 n=1 Tax=Macadamia integrifolia TaxID=60698 RepID=UPI001C4EAE43|nr:uncharacterized protein LOC122079176 [Macadamia integrifolia]
MQLITSQNFRSLLDFLRLDARDVALVFELRLGAYDVAHVYGLRLGTSNVAHVFELSDAHRIIKQDTGLRNAWLIRTSSLGGGLLKDSKLVIVCLVWNFEYLRLDTHPEFERGDFFHILL